MEKTYDNNFPKFQSTDVTEAESLVAVGNALPRDKFIPRFEEKDRGVDLAIEVIDDGLNKNYRAQIQVKGKESLEPLANGDYSISVETSNFNYLLNNPVSLYFLYLRDKSEIRFVWTWDERGRIETKNPDWIKQDHVNLHFTKILNQESVEEIRQRIMTQGKGIRVINENLFFANSPHVAFEVDSRTLEVTDLKELKETVESRGIGLCILGHSDWLLEKIRLFSKDERRHRKIRIPEIVAYFQKAQYQRAKELLAKLRAECNDLSNEERVLMDFVKLMCDARTTPTDFDEMVEQLRVLSEETTEPLPYNIRLNYLLTSIWTIDDHGARFSGLNERRRREIFEEFKNEIGGGPNPENESDLDRKNLLLLLKLESELRYFEMSAEMGRTELATVQFGSGNIQTVLSNYFEKAKEWENVIKNLLSRSTEPQMFADIVAQQAKLFFMQYGWRIILSDLGFDQAPLDPKWIEAVQTDLRRAIAIYDELELIPQRLETEISLAGFYFVGGRQEESTKLLASAISTARDYNLVEIITQAEHPIYVQTQALAERSRTEDKDEINARRDDRKIEMYAQQQIHAFSLPQERYENVRLGIEFVRDRAVEHLQWCESLELYEDDVHLRFPATMYRVNPNRTAICSKHGYQSNIDRPDWKRVSAEFKEKYCSKCPDRRPKRQADNQGSNNGLASDSE